MPERGNNLAPVAGSIDTGSSRVGESDTAAGEGQPSPAAGDLDAAAPERFAALNVVRRHCYIAWEQGVREGEALSDARIGLAALALWANHGNTDDLNAARRAFAAAAECDSRFGLARMSMHLICSWALLAARKGAR